MALHKITKGLHLPIKGEPEQVIHPGARVRSVALIAEDYVGMKPTMYVSVGDEVKRGQLLFEDKKTPGCALRCAGRGPYYGRQSRRAACLQSIVIALNDREIAGEPSAEDLVTFESYTGQGIEGLSTDQIEALLIESGLWTAFRTRPFSKAPVPGTRPRAIFITAMDTNPLAASVDAVLAGREEDLETVIPVHGQAGRTERLPVPGAGDQAGASGAQRRPSGGVPGPSPGWRCGRAYP